MMNHTSAEETAIWLDDNALSTEKVVELLRRQGAVPRLIREWILDETLEGTEIKKEARARLLNKYREDNNLTEDTAYFDHLEKRHINEVQLIKIIIRPYQVVKYREERWGPFANSLYLKHKERFDLVTYNRLESENADIMQEVYFRLKDGEESWESLARQFPGAGTEATAVQEAIPISQVEPEIVDVLRKVEPRRVARPIQLGNKVTVVSLIEFKSSKFDNEIRTKLLRQEFEDWLEQECNRMMNKVRFPK